MYLQWIEDHNIFNMLFGDNLHPEIIKRSREMLEFLYQNKKLTRTHLETLWDCATRTHEVKQTKSNWIIEI
jgi:hypothetical protein